MTVPIAALGAFLGLYLSLIHIYVLKTAEERLRQTNPGPEQKRYMELTMQSFRDNGACLLYTSRCV